jgi:hypothetical protein
MSEEKMIYVSPKARKLIFRILGTLALVSVVVIFILMLIGPVVGNVFTTINSSLGSASGSAGYAEPSANMGWAADGYPDQSGLAIVESYATAMAAPAAPRQAVTTERLIIRNGQLTLTVKDTLATQKEIEKVVADLAAQGAFIVSSNANIGYDGSSPSIDIVIRIPADNFDEVMDKIAGMSVSVNVRNETAQDVTADYVDLQTRLTALEAARDRLMEIMKQSATTEDLLQAEQQLTQRESEIESIKGQMKYLSESAQLSSITISLQPYRPDQPLDNSWRPAETVRRAIEGLVNSLRGFADFLIVFVISILPWLLFFGAIWWGVRRIIRKRQAGKVEETPKP